MRILLFSRALAREIEGNVRPCEPGLGSIVVGRPQRFGMVDSAHRHRDRIAVVVGEVDRTPAGLAMAALRDRRGAIKVGKRAGPAHGIGLEPHQGCKCAAAPLPAHAAMAVMNGGGLLVRAPAHPAT
jgi:hypothetical protein